MGMKRVWLLVGAVALAVVLVIGLSQAGGGGSSNPKSAAPADAKVKRQLEGAPEPLAALHAQANKLLGGGPKAFKARLADLKGYPVVVNKWASWCGPCRAEFPDFQKLSLRYGKTVAFLGVNGEDNAQEATDFLKRYPVSYPSYVDQSGTVAQTFNGASAFPTTVFYDRDGKLAYIHQGQYLREEHLQQDIERYALR
jgi:cytochrome c biogenesis protein CcmG, thiol:disulfide interchange protein DsbE